MTNHSTNRYTNLIVGDLVYCGSLENMREIAKKLRARRYTFSSFYDATNDEYIIKITGKRGKNAGN